MKISRITVILIVSLAGLSGIAAADHIEGAAVESGDSNWTQRGVNPDGEPAHFYPGQSEGDVGSMATVFQGEEGINYTLGLSTLETKSGDTLEVDRSTVPKGQGIGKYWQDPDNDSGSVSGQGDNISVVQPTVTPVDLINVNGDDISSGAEVKENEILLVRANPNYLKAEDVKIDIKGPEGGLDLEKAIVQSADIGKLTTEQNSSIRQSEGWSSRNLSNTTSIEQGIGKTNLSANDNTIWSLDFSGEDRGNYTITVEGTEDFEKDNNPVDEATATKTVNLITSSSKDSKPVERGVKPDGEPAEFYPGESEGDVGSGALAFQGEEGINFTFGDISVLESPTGDSLQVDRSIISKDQSPVSYWENPDDRSGKNLSVLSPTVEPVSMINKNGKDINSGAEIPGGIILVQSSSPNYLKAENVRISIEGPSGAEGLEKEMVKSAHLSKLTSEQNRTVNNSQGWGSKSGRTPGVGGENLTSIKQGIAATNLSHADDGIWAVDFTNEDPGEYNITVEGTDDFSTDNSPVDSATSSNTLELAPGSNTESRSVKRGVDPETGSNVYFHPGTSEGNVSSTATVFQGEEGIYYKLNGLSTLESEVGDTLEVSRSSVPKSQGTGTYWQDPDNDSSRIPGRGVNVTVATPEVTGINIVDANGKTVDNRTVGGEEQLLLTAPWNYMKAEDLKIQVISPSDGTDVTKTVLDSTYKKLSESQISYLKDLPSWNKNRIENGNLTNSKQGVGHTKLGLDSPAAWHIDMGNAGVAGEYKILVEGIDDFGKDNNPVSDAWEETGIQVGPKVNTGTVELGDGEEWRTVKLKDSYEKPVVFTETEEVGTEAQVRSVESDQFQVRLPPVVESVGDSAEQEVGYVVMEEGSHLLQNATEKQLESLRQYVVNTHLPHVSEETKTQLTDVPSDGNTSPGRLDRVVVDTTETGENSTDVPTKFDSTPVVSTQVQNGSMASGSVYGNVTSEGFDVASRGNPQPVDLGFLAVTPGENRIDGVEYEAGYVEIGNQTDTQVVFAQEFEGEPVVLAGEPGVKSGDTGVSNVTATGFRITGNSLEGEKVGYLAVERSR
ncbi:MAG: hypothetical protein ABEK59_00745 [Halobacteria archaeon]